MDRTHATFGEIVGHFNGTVDQYVPAMEKLPCIDIPGNPPPYYPQGLGRCMDQDYDFGLRRLVISGERPRIASGDAADAIRGRSPEMTRRRRPLRALLRFFDRALLGPILGVGAFIIERRVVRAMKAAPPKGASGKLQATGDEPDRSQAQG